MDPTTLFSGNDLQLILIAFGFSLVLGFVLFMFARSFSAGKDMDFEEQLREILVDELAGGDDDSPKTLVDKWMFMWARLFREMGWQRYDDNPRQAGIDVLVGWVVIAAATSAVAANLFVGPVLASALVFGLLIIVKNTAAKKADAISDQLPGFLFALKANIQANETPERAILKVVSAMPSPLYDDLLIVQSHILANSTFKEALLDLKEKTANRDLKFLASCMIQATSSGANIESQIATIQNVLDARREVSDEINQAARAASPAIWASSIAIPGAFIAIYFGDPNAASFWFVNPISWALLGVIGALWGAGVYFSRRMVTQIRNM